MSPDDIIARIESCPPKASILVIFDSRTQPEAVDLRKRLGLDRFVCRCVHKRRSVYIAYATMTGLHRIPLEVTWAEVILAGPNARTVASLLAMTSNHTQEN